MRKVMLAGLAAMLMAIAGCSGGGESTPQVIDDASVVGAWLNTTPAVTARTAADPDYCWPTQLLTLAPERTFRFEDESPDTWATGTYTASTGQLQMTRTGGQGQAGLAPAGAYIYTMLNGLLGLSEDVSEPGRAFSLSRLATDTPASLVTEWLVVRQLSAGNSDLPVLDTTRWTITQSGNVTLTYYDAGTRLATTCDGTLLLTRDAYLGLRLPAAGTTPGHLYLLGSGHLTNGVLSLTTPEGTMTVCASRTAPDTRLLGRWQQEHGGASAMQFSADGTFTLTRENQTFTGSWRTYRGGYLTMLMPEEQHTCHAEILTRDTTTYLILGEWRTRGQQPPQYEEVTLVKMG